jgi:capsular exopolysaccharide synthesis family protein
MQGSNLILGKRIMIKNMPDLPYAVEEAVNRLRVNVSFLPDHVRKIMVISTTQDEGKSFVTMQLWRQMAETGMPSVLLDADLRKSVIAEKYGFKREGREKQKGLSYYLSHDMPLEEVVWQTNIPNGDIVANIDNVVNPSMLLEGQKFARLLETLAVNYRYVFIDTPPLGVVSDGEKIGSMCDGAILVVHGGVTSKRMVRNSISQLERAGCPLLGIVLNRVNGKESGYYYKRYGRKYGYYGKNGYYGKEAYYC